MNFIFLEAVIMLLSIEMSYIRCEKIEPEITLDLRLNQWEQLVIDDVVMGSDAYNQNVSLIVDNYVAILIKKVLDSYDIKGEIVRLKRDKKLKELTK